MVTAYGIDYSRSRPLPSAILAAGKSFVVRYLAYLPNTKVITKSELDALHNAGLGVVFNWEEGATDALQGAGLGREHAREALRQLNLLGAPAVPVYFSVDFNVQNNSQMMAVRGYLTGAASVLGVQRVGVYGSNTVMTACVPTFATWGWQTYAWSHGIISSKAHLYQYQNDVRLAGADVDLDRSLKDSFGAWLPQRKEHTMFPLDGYQTAELTHGDNDAHYDGYHNVTRLQILLNGLYGKGVTVDGVYGDATAKAVREVFDGITGSDGSKVTVKEWVILNGVTHV